MGRRDDPKGGHRLADRRGAGRRGRALRPVSALTHPEVRALSVLDRAFVGTVRRHDSRFPTPGATILGSPRLTDRPGPEPQRRGGLVLAWMRARAPPSRGRSGVPGSSRSMSSGAWSDGTGGPLRASRSISASTIARRHWRRDQQLVDAHPEVLVEHPGPVVPPRVAAGLVVPRPVGVGEPAVEQRPDGGALRLRDVGAAVDRAPGPRRRRRSGPR